MAAATPAQSTPVRLSEDWLATLIGLIIVFVVGSGLLGPGRQNVSLSAEAGQTASAALRPLGGWVVSASLDGERASAADAPTSFADGENVIFTCLDGQLSAQSEIALPAGSSAPPEGRAQVIIVNQCDAAVSITYQTNALIPWPVFNLFSR